MSFGKKGIMFTILAVLMCAVIISSFFMVYDLPLDQNVDNTKIRVSGMNQYVDQTEIYIGDITYVSGLKTLEFMNDIMIGNNSFLVNFTEEYISCMTVGSIDVPWSGSVVTCPQDAYLYSKINEFESFSNNRMGINSDITVNRLELTQNSPWDLLLIINYTLKINDSYAYWNETRVVEKHMSIIGLKDPTYYIVKNTSPLYAARFDMRINSSTSTASWTEKPSTANQVVVSKRYFEWSLAPSFLNRLNNKTTSSEYGIVSIVSFNNTALMSGRSSIDYEFWKGIATQAPYIRYDFWAAGVTDAERAEYNIYANIFGLNGTIIPGTLKNEINMTDVSYYVVQVI
ncbi:MAG: hypothetical protein WC758_00980 [Candidatus Woesearchaeota archaeon]|jgi:hypothetical protein